MLRRRCVALAALLALTAVSCGKKTEQKGAESSPPGGGSKPLI